MMENGLDVSSSIAADDSSGPKAGEATASQLAEGVGLEVRCLSPMFFKPSCRATHVGCSCQCLSIHEVTCLPSDRAVC